MSKNSIISSRSGRLIALCWLVYAFSYLGKLSYSANILPIGVDYDVPYAQTGMVTTFFFFAYGAGQIVNGLLCKHYNVRWVIFASLLTSSLMNTLVVLAPSFAYIKFFWLVNGISMSFLWTSLIRLLSETLPKKDVSKAVVIMGTTVATGTFVIYGLSALFTAVASYRVTFFVAAGVLVAIALVWVFCFQPLVAPLREERKQEQVTLPSLARAESATKDFVSLKWLVAILAFFAVANNFVKDGLTAWTPDILAAIYHTEDWLSILLTLLLPVVSIAGTVLALAIQRKTNSFVATCTVLFCIGAVLIGTVIAFLPNDALVLSIACFAAVACVMAGVNNVVTSMMPLHLKSTGNSGLLAGVLNGFCYLGSTASAYGLGAIADHATWNTVFYVLLGVACAVTLLGATFTVTVRAIKKRREQCLCASPLENNTQENTDET